MEIEVSVTINVKSQTLLDYKEEKKNKVLFKRYARSSVKRSV